MTWTSMLRCMQIKNTLKETVSLTFLHWLNLIFFSKTSLASSFRNSSWNFLMQALCSLRSCIIKHQSFLRENEAIRRSINWPRLAIDAYNANKLMLLLVNTPWKFSLSDVHQSSITWTDKNWSSEHLATVGSKMRLAYSFDVARFGAGQSCGKDFEFAFKPLRCIVYFNKNAKHEKQIPTSTQTYWSCQRSQDLRTKFQGLRFQYSILVGVLTPSRRTD